MESNEHVEWLTLPQIQQRYDALAAAQPEPITLDRELRSLYGLVLTCAPSADRTRWLQALNPLLDRAGQQAVRELERQAQSKPAPNELIATSAEIESSRGLLARWSDDWDNTMFAALASPILCLQREQRLRRQSQTLLRQAVLRGDADGFLALLTKMPLAAVRSWLLRRILQHRQIGQSGVELQHCVVFLMATCQSPGDCAALAAELEPILGELDTSAPHRLVYAKNLSND